MMHKLPTSLASFFYYFIKPYKRHVLGFIVIGFIWAIINSLLPYTLKHIIDKAFELSTHKELIFDAIKQLAFFYIALWATMACIMRLLDYNKLCFFPAVREDITNTMYQYLSNHSHNYFQNNFAGSLANKISDMTNGAIAVFIVLDDCFAQALGLIVAITLMFVVHPIFAGIFIIWALSFIGIAIYFSKHIKVLSDDLATSRTLLVGKIVDSISNIMNIRLFAKNTYEQKNIAIAVKQAETKNRNTQKYILKMHIFFDISIVLLVAAMMFSLIFMYSKGLVTAGDFAFIISLSISMFFQLWYVTNQFVQFAQELGKCSQALNIITAPHEVVDNKKAKALKVTKARIEFNNVTFHYNKGLNIFKNKNIIINPGEKVGLVGFSGSGKSTFVNLILRFFDIESGAIFIDDQNIAKVTQSSIREHISIIPQDASLFHRSLIENIRYGRIEATNEEVIAASKKVHCHEFICALPEGYDSLVGDRGIKLSGGQRQRIAIARAMLKNSPIIILDEATSSLDSITEKQIQESLHALMIGSTTIVIAHRLSTLAEMDRILVFDKGHIIEENTHEKLLKNKGHYSRMWHMQAGGFLPENEEKMND